jgi:hypothetical protein
VKSGSPNVLLESGANVIVCAFVAVGRVSAISDEAD